MGRPSLTGESIVVEIDGDLLVWTDGLISGTNRDLIAAAKRVSDLELPVNITALGPEILASIETVDSPERAVAALVGAAPGRARLIKVPQEVLYLLPFPLEEDHEDDTEESTSEEN